ncbi:MAG: N-acetylmuramoyl-L-alanine amidase, partial [Clostridia bacterium]|nr:N-acetylmuramoyl-L-alanine amidase [Clostridia bacterium]
VSVHYVIERDGTVHCYIPEERVAWHAGRGSFGGDAKYTNKMNLYAIGIELLAMGTEEEMSAFSYCASIKSLYCLIRVSSRSDCSPSGFDSRSTPVSRWPRSGRGCP